MSARMIPRRKCWTCWIRHRIPSTGRTLGLLRRSAIRWRSPCRTQTERKNNTGTGRTSINVVLSGRCDLIAPAGGKVLLAEKLPNVGNTLVIEHGAGVKTIYYGLRRLTVEKGAIVAQGDALGTTDKATVVEVRVGKTPVEPLRILRGQCDALRSY